MFGHDWQSTRGTIVEVREKSRSGDGLVGINEYIVDTILPSGQQLRALVEEPRIATDFWPPSRGDVVGVEVDLKNNHVRFDKSDPQLSAKARRKAREDGFAATLRQTPGTPAGGVVPGSGMNGTPGMHVIKLDPASAEGQQIAEWIGRVTGQQPSD